MKLKQIVISIENSSERLLEVTRALGEQGINLRALSLVDTGAFGQLRLLVSDVAKTRRILMKMHMPAFVNDVVAVEVEDKPGSLARLLEPLTEAGEELIRLGGDAIQPAGIAQDDLERSEQRHDDEQGEHHEARRRHPRLSLRTGNR